MFLRMFPLDTREGWWSILQGNRLVLWSRFIYSMQENERWNDGAINGIIGALLAFFFKRTFETASSWRASLNRNPRNRVALLSIIRFRNRLAMKINSFFDLNLHTTIISSHRGTRHLWELGKNEKIVPFSVFWKEGIERLKRPLLDECLWIEIVAMHYSIQKQISYEKLILSSILLYNTTIISSHRGTRRLSLR